MIDGRNPVFYHKDKEVKIVDYDKISMEVTYKTISTSNTKYTCFDWEISCNLGVNYYVAFLNMIAEKEREIA